MATDHAINRDSRPIDSGRGRPLRTPERWSDRPHPLLEGVSASLAVAEGADMNIDDTAGTPHSTVGEPVIGAGTGSDGRLSIDLCLDPPGLRIVGDLDRITVPALTEALASIGSGSFFVDLSGLVFIDVGGLRALVMAAARMEGGHVLTLCSA
jgi:ABC-type transporter Mla MlaB component